MVVRLAFAVAIHVDPEVLLVDESLAVGDIYFRQRCLRKVHELRARGITILFVSHAVSDVKTLGDRTMWLEHGRMMDIGDTERVVGEVPGGDDRERYAVPAVEKRSLEALTALRARAAHGGDRYDTQYRSPIRRRQGRDPGHRAAERRR